MAKSGELEYYLEYTTEENSTLSLYTDLLLLRSYIYPNISTLTSRTGVSITNISNNNSGDDIDLNITTVLIPG